MNNDRILSLWKSERYGLVSAALEDLLSSEEPKDRVVAVELITVFGPTIFMQIVDDFFDIEEFVHGQGIIHYLINHLPTDVKTQILPMLFQRLLSVCPNEQNTAFHVLLNIGCMNEQTTRELVEIVKAKALGYSDRLTNNAISILANYGSQSEKVLPYLKMLVQDDSIPQKMRMHAAEALAQVADDISEFQGTFIDAQIDGLTFHDTIKSIYKAQIQTAKMTTETEEADVADKITAHIHKLVSQGIEPFAIDEQSHKELELKKKVDKIFSSQEDD